MKSKYTSIIKIVWLFFLVLVPSFFVVIHSAAQCADWMDVSKTGENQFGFALDDQGNVYYGGQFFDSVTAGNQLITSDTSLGYASVFIAKVDSNGNLLWERHFTNSGDDNGIFNPELAWHNGILYVSGFFRDSLINETGQILLSSPTFFSMYVISLSSADGQIIHTKTFSTTNPSSSAYSGLYGITVGSDGKIFITGRFRYSVTFDAITLISSTSRIAFIACLDANMNTVWAKKSTHTTTVTTSISRGYSIVTDSHHNVILGGFTWKDIQFDNELFQTNNDAGSNPYIAKFDSSGNCLWIRGGKGDGVFQNVYALDVDESDNIYMSSPMDDTLQFNGTTLNATNGHLYLNKFDGNGNLLWSVQDGIDTSGGSVTPFISDVFWKPGQVWCTGWGGSSTGGDPDFSGPVFVLQFDEDGNEETFIPTFGCQSSYHLAADNNGNLYVGGTLHGDSVSAGNVQTTYPDSLSGPFLLKLCDVVTLVQNIPGDHSVFLFPNPASGYFNIEVAAANGTLHFYLIDLMGRILQQKEITDASGEVRLKFDISSYPAGSYFVRVVNDENTTMKQLQVVR